MIKNISVGARSLLALALVATTAFLGFGPLRTQAHEDPGGCFSNGVTLSITVYRADGTTPVGGGSVESGETINYGATLSHAGGSNCNYEGGTLTITTPDGVPHVVASGAGIPLVTSVSPFVAPQQSYVVSEADVNILGLLPADVDYAGGISHTPTIHQTAGANVDISTPYQDVALEVTKTAIPASEITYEWTIDKSVTPATWDMFSGDSGTSQYTITLDKSVGATNHSVSGTITIHNPAQFASANITDVTDSITGIGAVTVVCPGGLPQLLAPGADLVCTYSSALPDSSTRTNTATATTDGDVGGNEDEETIDFSSVVPTEVNGTVNVDDTFNAGDNGPFSDDAQYSYDRTFFCDEDEGVHNNTATIVETQQSDDASVTVNCYSLTVEKTANTSFDRQYHWNVDKTADQTEIELATGEFFDIHYTVTANVTGSTDSNWAVSGTITVNNPAPVAATVNSVSDAVSGVGAMTVDCGPAVFPYTLAAGDDLVCTYSGVLPDGSNRTNTATATQQNYDYDSQGLGTPSGTTDYSGQAAVTFGAPTNVFDEEVTVTDSYAGVLGTATVAESPKQFQYTRTVMYTDQECGDHTVDNTATITTNDTQTQDTDDWSVLVHVNCLTGCTLTQGYWKTHNESFKGGAPADDNWYNIGPLAENTTFFLSGTTWFNVFWTASKGNVYYTLAHQYMAAVPNSLNGAAVPANVQNAINSATNLFNAFTPAQAAGLKGAAKQTWINLAGILGSYNEGLIGPGHCDEQVPL